MSSYLIAQQERTVNNQIPGREVVCSFELIKHKRAPVAAIQNIRKPEENEQKKTQQQRTTAASEVCTKPNGKLLDSAVVLQGC